MAHYAQVNDDGTVLQVLVMSNDMEANEGEQACIDWLRDKVRDPQGQFTKWVKTSYNHKIRKQFAGLGHTYDEVKDKFISTQPFASWVLDAEDDWQAPVAEPTDEEIEAESTKQGVSVRPVWDEKTQTWIYTDVAVIKDRHP